MDAKLHDLFPKIQTLVSISVTMRSLEARLIDNCHDVSVFFLHLLNIVCLAIAFLICVSPSFDLAHVIKSRFRHSIKVRERAVKTIKKSETENSK